MVTHVDGQNVKCLPIESGPVKIVHISELKPLKEEKGKKNIFVLKLLDSDASFESDTEIICAGLASGRPAQGRSPSWKVEYVLIGMPLTSDLTNLRIQPNSG